MERCVLGDMETVVWGELWRGVLGRHVERSVLGRHGEGCVGRIMERCVGETCGAVRSVWGRFVERSVLRKTCGAVCVGETWRGVLGRHGEVCVGETWRGLCGGNMERSV